MSAVVRPAGAAVGPAAFSFFSSCPFCLGSFSPSDIPAGSVDWGGWEPAESVDLAGGLACSVLPSVLVLFFIWRIGDAALHE